MINLPPSKPMLKWYAQVVSGEQVAYIGKVGESEDVLLICNPDALPPDVTPLTAEAVATRLRMTFEEEPTP